MEHQPYNDPDTAPIYILCIFTVLFCVYFGWLGSVAIRLYLYKGALEPEPERFVILPAYLRDRSPQRGHHRRVTAFPIPAPPKSPARELARLSKATRVNIADVDASSPPDPEVRAFLAEQQRISRLPAFIQDDCGDGSDFPDVPVAITPVEVKQQMLAPPGLKRTPTAKYRSAGVKKLAPNEWLIITDSETYLTPSHSLRPSTSSRAATSTSRRTQVTALSRISSLSKNRKTSSLAIFPRCHLNTLSCGASIRSSAACQNLEPLCSQRERR